MVSNYKRRIYYADTDAGGVVYHARYLDMLESARTEYLRESGLTHQKIADEYQGIFVVRSIEMDYCRPIKLDDEITITSFVLSKGRSSLVFSQEINHGGTLIAKAKLVLVFIDSIKHAPKKIPFEIGLENRG